MPQRAISLPIWASNAWGVLPTAMTEGIAVRETTSFCATSRTIVSFPPPGGNGTMKRTGLVG
jgi:hypothetical protein